MKELLYYIVGLISKAHHHIMQLNDAYEANFSDKELHFLVIGLLGMAMIFVIFPFFSYLAKKGHLMFLSWIYVFTVVVVILPADSRVSLNETDNFLHSLGYEHIPDTGAYKVLQNNHERVALFAHQGFGLAFLSCMLDIAYPQFSIHFDMGHTGMTVIEFKEEGGIAIPRVLTLASDSHIYHEGLPTNYQNKLRF